MAAGLGFKTFQVGEVLLSSDVNGYLMQGVLVFASAAARDAAITSPQEGQCCYLKDTDAVQTYSGSTWVGFDDSNAIQNSIVDAKGDIVAASGNDTPARLAVGSNGDTLVADSAATTGLRYSPTPSASNPVINSAFQVWQRGTSFVPATTAGTSYTADRWSAYRNAVGSTISRQVTNDTTNLPFIQYCARVARDSGNSSTEVILLANPFEIANSIPFAGKTVTFSYYARKGANYSAASDALTVVVLRGTGSSETNPIFSGYTGQSAVLNTTVTLTGTWQRFTHTFTFAAADTQFAPYFQHTPVGTAGAADYYEITGVQIDIGSVALPFRTYAGTIQGELAACQRYCFAVTSGATDRTISQGTYYNSTTFVSTVAFPVTMRTTPSATIVTSTSYWAIYGNNTADGADAASFGGAGLNAGNLEITGNASGTQGTGGQLRSNNAAASVILSAEL